jgi:hypothetical protein
MEDFKRKIKIMLAMTFQECKQDERNPNDTSEYGGSSYYKDYEDADYFGGIYRLWTPKDHHGPMVESLNFTLYPKTVGRKGFEGVWYTVTNDLRVWRTPGVTRKRALVNYHFIHQYYSPVPPELRVDWEANPTRPKV